MNIKHEIPGVDTESAGMGGRTHQRTGDRGHVQPNPHIADGEMKNQISIASLCGWISFARPQPRRRGLGSWMPWLQLALRRCPGGKDDDTWRELDNSAKILYSTERFIYHFMTCIHAQNLFRFDVDDIVGPEKLRHWNHPICLVAGDASSVTPYSRSAVYERCDHLPDPKPVKRYQIRKKK
jgi:hypothetical protein